MSYPTMYSVFFFKIFNSFRINTKMTFYSKILCLKSIIGCKSIIYFILGVLLSIFFNSFTRNINISDVVEKKPSVKAFSLLPIYSSLMETDESELSIRNMDLKETTLKIEAVGSVHMALEMLKLGKYDKAHKLFEHAIALAPKHPDVLNYYGEFLESTKNDIIKADQLYFKALTYSPKHAAASINRGRLAAVVEEMDRSTLRRIDKKRDTVAQIPDSNSALRKAKKETYFQHIYHTVGIEGNTMSLSQTRSVVETRMAVGGKSVAEHNEILGLDAALKYINTTLINKIGRITLEDILEIHRRVLGFVDPIEGGSFRTTQVFVGGHIPPSPSNIPPLMKQFETWLNSWSALSLHPVRYAALAHYKLVHIHPFHDGNGRTSRLLMNTILMQAGYPPVIILKQDRHRYYRMIELANEGDVRPFVRFIAECTERTLDLFLWNTSEYSSELPAITDKINKYSD